ncbi:MAG: hypothetical protein GF399_07655 [Candidatus Coatesbacteria bacterium]|nr:hypothetical protein [Candidatus Coatesbacteria bacterium]
MEKKEIVYAIIVTNVSNNNKHLYIGKTGTLNKTGLSCPYQRIATHINPIGKTSSAFKKMEELYKTENKNVNWRDIRFIYVWFDIESNVAAIEKCLQYHYTEKQHSFYTLWYS